MGVSTIDGTLEEAVLKRVRRNLRIYERLTFRLRDGTSKSIAKAIVEAPLAERLLPGTSGRFYLYTAIDHRGLHGLRDESGQATYAYPKNNEKALLVVIPIMLLWVGVSIAFLGGIPILGGLALLLSVPAYFLYRGTRTEAERQFQADSGHVPAAPLAASSPAAGA
ncbi:MAG TPA: hypothetical protein VN231_02065 [Allosphingosinicella sp.]|nr:hypothetical protein [Allosphingosinicella sp.]